MKPHKCPVCGGNGIVPAGFYNSTNISEDGTIIITTGDADTTACRSCAGTGIVYSPDFQYSISDDIKSADTGR